MSGLITTAVESMMNTSLIPPDDIANIASLVHIPDISMPIDVGGERLAMWNVNLASVSMLTPYGILTNGVLSILWHIFVVVMCVATWFVDLVVGLSWVDPVMAPVRTLADNLRTLLGELNLFILLLTMSAFLCAIWIVRGRHAQGFGQLLLSLFIAYLSMGSLGSNDSQVSSWNPFDLVVGRAGSDQGGLLYEVRNIGNDVGSLAFGDQTLALAAQSSPGRDLAEAFILNTAMIVNFGEPLTGDCRTAYAIVQTAAQGRPKTTEELRDLLGDLRGQGLAKDGAADDLADQVGARGGAQEFGAWLGIITPLGGAAVREFFDSDGMVDRNVHLLTVAGACQHNNAFHYVERVNPNVSLLTLLIAGPPITFALIFVGVVALFTMFASIIFVFQALKLLLALLAAIVPVETFRIGLPKTLASALTSAAMVIFSIVFLRLAASAIADQVFSISPPGVEQGTGGVVAQVIGTIGRWYMLAFTAVIFLIIFWRGRTAIEAARGRVSDQISRLMGEREYSENTAPMGVLQEVGYLNTFGDLATKAKLLR